jgi:glycosyltransferase involved in cell wall biosynthesis
MTELKVVLLTTIFPMNQQFLIDFFESLNSQTHDNFNVVVVNDGYLNFNEIKLKYSKLNIVELEYSNTPAKNREYGINYCIERKYDILIFGDSDDYFSNNRVELALEALNSNDIVVNDVSLFDDRGVYETMYISNRLSDNSKVNYSYIKNKNIFGLSNTALKINTLSKVSFDKDLVAVDWYLYKGLLKNGCKAIFTNKAITYYRQHKDNTVGLQAIKDKYYLWWEQRDGEAS